MTIRLFSHALRMLFSNFGDALKLSLIPFLLIQAVSVGLQYFVLGSISTGLELQETELGPGFAVVQLLSVLASLVLGAWIAVGWHRFVLAEEYPDGYVPAFRQEEVLLYIWKLIVTVFLLILLSVPVGIVASLSFGVNVVIGGPIILLRAGFLLWAMVRLSVMLPAASIGRNMAVQEAWAATAPLGLSTLGASLLVGLFSLAIFTVTLAVLFSLPLFLMASAAVSLLTTLLGVSLLTTIYGVAVEGRQLT